MRIPVAAVTLVLAACVKTINPEPVPVPGVPLQTWSVEVREPRARDIFMRNDSERELTVTSVQLYNCRNLKQECRAYQTNVTIPPGKTVKAMRLEPENLKLSWRYNYNFQLRGQTVTVAMAPATMSAMVAGSAVGTQLSDPQEFRAAVSPITDNGTCSPQNPMRGPDGTTGWMIVFGVSEANMRSVMVYATADNKVTQYSDSRTRADGQRTSITVIIEPQLAFMRNYGGDAPDLRFNVSGPDVLTAPSLGNPGAIVAHVLRECRKQ